MRSIFLAVTVTTAYAHLRGWPAEVHPVLRACFAVLVLVLGIGLWRRRVRPNYGLARSVRPARWPDYLAVGLGILAMECSLLFFLSTAPRPAQVLASRVDGLFHPVSISAQSPAAAASASTGDVISGNWLWDDQGKRRLPLRSNAKPSNKPEVFFRPANRETTGQLLLSRTYVRAFAMERFEDSSWAPLKMKEESLSAGPDGWLSLDSPASRPGFLLRGEIFHGARPEGDNVFIAPEGAVRARLSELRKVAPGIFRLNPLRDPGAGYNYEVEARTVTFGNLLESGALAAFLLPRDVPEHLVTLPEQPELRQALIDIAIKTQGPIESRLLALRKLLHQQYEYSLEIENADQRDPLVNFLLYERRGHCEFFATAGALLCRALDIPARVAYGWSGGRYFGAQDLFMFRAREAHAWTEIYLRDVGWVVFDTTPPGALEAASSSIALPDEKPPLDDDGNIIFDSPGSGGGGPSLWPFVALGLGLALGALAIITLRLRKRPVALSGNASTSLLPDAPGYLASFRQACLRLGRPMPTGRTLRQQLADLARQNRRPAFADELLDYHYAVTYGNSRPDRSRETRLLKAIRRWSPRSN